MFIVLPIVLLMVCTVAVALQERARTTNPHGKSVKVPCSPCHSTEGWIPIRPDNGFDHDATGFPLKGAHAIIDCRHCHVNLVFSDIGTQCTDCHADIHRRQMGSDCEECHSVHGWQEIKRNITGHRNRFPLMGAHSALQCESCHTNGAVGLFRGLRTDCDFCHHEDYLNAQSVDHQQADFPLDCEFCHSMDSWYSGFNHEAFTGFPLSGAHASLDCLECHTGGNFQGTPANCVECHRQEYNETTNPNHIASGFPEDCSLCHSSVSWMDAFFDHSGTQFPLTGAHVTLDCQDCHSSGQYVGLPSDCYACHAEDYNNTIDPSHIAAGFPQDCSECHTTSGWTGANFIHDQFPIYSGAHRNEWTACSDCHTNPGNYTVFSCLSCHGRTETDSHHREVRDYVYNSANCYACHPTGRAEDD